MVESAVKRYPETVTCTLCGAEIKPEHHNVRVIGAATVRVKDSDMLIISCRKCVKKTAVVNGGSA